MRTPIRSPLAAVGVTLALALLAALAMRAGAIPHRNPELADARMRATIEHDADALGVALDTLAARLSVPTLDSTAARRIRAAYRVSRERYKAVEAVVEFYAPAVAAALNSRRQEVDDDDAPPPSVLAAGGFPALDTLVWPTATRASAAGALTVLRRMRAQVARIRGLAAPLAPTDAQIVELARLELARVSTLGIAGFDAHRTGAALRESAAALDGVRLLFAAAGPDRWPNLVTERADVDATWERAAAALRAHQNFDTFDRLAFIANYAEPAARAVGALRRAAGIAPVQMLRGWRANASSVFAEGAFDARAYAADAAPVPTRALVALGATLFFEPALSGTGTRSCASCHDPSHAFADGLRTSAALRPGGPSPRRHTPTLINAALQPAQFTDERAVTLEDQVSDVLRSPAEMGSSAERAAGSLATSARYRALFARAFGSARLATAVTPLRLRLALGAFVRSLVSMNSRFDRAARGDAGAVTAEERRGFDLFMGKAGCGTCHFAPLFSGNTPPLYLNSDVEVIGTPAAVNRPALPDADRGRARIDHMPQHVRAFKTPSLRNVAMTGPYMHNGVFRTLDQVLRFYDGGGAQGAGARISNQTLSADSLHLSVADRRAIIAFLGTLTDQPTLLKHTAPR